MMPRPASWYPLASADPVPGDPDAVRTAGHRHGGVAAGIATAANRLGTLLELPGAQTQAVDAIRAQWASLDAQLDRLRTGYDAVCAAMLRYAQALSIAQARSWSALVAARAAQSAIDTAEAELRRAQIALSTCPPEHVATCRLAVTRARSRVRDGDVALDRARHDLDDALVEYHAAVALARATVDDLTVGADARAIWDGTVLAAIGAVGLDALPALDGDPTQAARWWAGLTEAARLVLVARFPERIGALDGLPVSARDVANRIVLARALDEARAAVARAQEQLEEAARSVTSRASAGPAEAALRARGVAEQHLAMLETVALTLALYAGTSLMVLDTTMPGRAAIASGDVDAADHVAVLVPGLDSFVTNYTGDLTTNAERVRKTAEIALDYAGRNETIAAIAWIGYEAPTIGTVMSDGHAKAGAASLAATLAGIEANRAVHGGQVHLVTLGHSYGSLVAGLAAAGETAMDDLVVFGSPGVGTNRVSNLTLPADRVFAGEARNDPVADLDWFGADPASPAFGAVPFQTDGGQHPLAGGLTAEVTGHSDYYAPGSESLWNITAVVIGEREAVTMGHTSGFGDRLRDSLFIADAEPPPSRFAQVP